MADVHAEAGYGKDITFRHHKAALFTLAFQTLGIIYSDIGTSPLYTMNGLWPAGSDIPPDEDVIGGLSAIIWALTLLPLLKYVFICLRFGTMEGEGGTFALFQGLYPPERKYINKPSEKDTGLEKTNSDSSVELMPSTSTAPSKFKWLVFVWCIFGTSLTLADGVFTPAVSVTSAVGGIAVAKPSVGSDLVGISIALLVVLFLVQFRGTAQIGFLFAPVTFVWFALIAVTGAINIATHPGVFRAFDPSRAILYFVRTKNYDLLSGVLLALTGCEAMFASLGHFNALAIQMSFTCIVYPAVILAYLGQGARLISAATDADKTYLMTNFFYTTIPGPTNGPLYWVIFVFAILATFIASQTLITAAFSLVQQLIKMHVLPPFRIVHTSKTIYGQIYIPAVNWTLAAVVIIVVATFHNSTKLNNAYGFSVATVMFSTTTLIAVQMVYVKHLAFYIAIAFFLFFGFLDGLFWGAALKKVPEGAWVPLLIGFLTMFIMLFWSWAKGLEDAFDGANRKDVHRLILRKETKDTKDKDSDRTPANDEVLEEVAYAQEEDDVTREKYFIRNGDGLAVDAFMAKSGAGPVELARLPICAVFHRLTTGRGIPHSFASFIRQWPALPRVVIFLSVDVMSIAYVHPEDRFLVRKVAAVKGFYTATYRLGYRERFDSQMNAVIDQICDLEIRQDPQSGPATAEEIRAIAGRTTHIVPHYVVASKDILSQDSGFSKLITWGVDYARRFLIEEVYYRLAIMFPETTNWRGSAAEIIHVGVNALL